MSIFKPFIINHQVYKTNSDNYYTTLYMLSCLCVGIRNKSLKVIKLQ